jgi:hypothetical protein
MHLSPNDERKVDAFAQGGQPEYSWFMPEAEGQGPVERVLFCHDVFNRRYRFLINALGQVLPPEIRRPEECGPPSAMHWSTDVRLWAQPVQP